jgi:hypothetical protein
MEKRINQTEKPMCKNFEKCLERAFKAMADEPTLKWGPVTDPALGRGKSVPMPKDNWALELLKLSQDKE